MFKITINDEQAGKYITKLKQKMSDYMRAGEELPENNPDPFEETPFNRIEEVKLSSDDWLDVILSQAEKSVLRP